MADLISTWNEVIDFKITSKDLKQPSNQFFLNALSAYLEKLNINVENMKFGIFENDFDRLFLIRFCACIDELYKLSNPSHNFHYMDLKCPTGKKCTHVLKTLLNYLHYVEMVKLEVANHASAFIDDFDNALSQHNAIQTENEMVKQRIRKIDAMLEEYKKIIPQRQQNIAKMVAEEKVLTKGCQDFQEQLRTIDAQIIKLQMKKEELEQLIVNIKDYESQELSINKLTVEYEELKAIRDSNQESNIGLNAQIHNMNACFEMICSVNELLKNECFEKFRHFEASLIGMKKEESNLIQNAGNLTKNIEKLRTQIEQLNMDYTNIQKNLQCLQMDSNRHLSNLKDEKEEISNLVDLLKDMCAQQRDLENEKIAIRNFLSKSWGQIFNNMTSMRKRNT